MKMGNPSVKMWVSKQNNGQMNVQNQAATYGGICKKTLLFAGITVLAALLAVIGYKFALGSGNTVVLTAVYIGVAVSAIPMLVLSLIIAFKPNTVKVLGIIYSILQGALLGIVVYWVDVFYPGIALAAFLGTVIVFVITVALNKLLEARVSNKLYRCVMIAFLSLVLVQLVMLVLSLCGVYNFQAYFWIQFAISALCVIMATMCLLWDLQNIDTIVKCGADKSFEWCLAFSLVTTLVYLYMEILELLLRLAMIFARNKD